MWWQLLRLRYLLSSTSKVAFAQVRSSADSIFRGRYSPAPLQMVYGKIIGYMSRMGELETPAASGAPQGAQRSCTLM